jgi:hypothetical protein
MGKGKPVVPFVDEMVTRRLVLRAEDVVFVKGIVEASEGLAQLYAERGGDVTLAAPVARAEELDRLIEDLAQEAIAIVEGATPRRPP